MAIITFDKNEVIDYVPEADRGSADPCVISMKPVTFGEVERYQAMLISQMKGVKNDASRGAEIARGVQRRQFCEHVVGVRNFKVQRAGTVVDITTADELYDVADNALITELIQAMENAARLSAGQLANFQPAFGTASS